MLCFKLFNWETIYFFLTGGCFNKSGKLYLVLTFHAVRRDADADSICEELSARIYRNILIFVNKSLPFFFRHTIFFVRPEMSLR